MKKPRIVIIIEDGLISEVKVSGLPKNTIIEQIDHDTEDWSNEDNPLCKCKIGGGNEHHHSEYEPEFVR